MDIIVHSLYSNKDIFLRELVSNSADALDKVRFLSLTDSSALGEGSAKDLPLEIKISVDKEKRILSLRDTGVGMTKTDLINNLGTIARSGTAAFLEQMQKGGDLNLIGQFGVGFYSVYLVSDYVEVVTKHADDKQWVWESTASGSFAISEDTTGAPLGRGTQINIHLKEEAKEYIQEAKLRELIARYSEFISFPISILVEKEVEKEVPIEEEGPAEKPTEEKKASEGDEDADEAVEEDEEEEEKPKTKKVKETVQEWEVLNDSKALWLRPPGNVSDEEYDKFYGALVKDEFEKPLAHSHFRAEGDVDFKAVLYLPDSAPADMYDNYYTKKPRVKLYVRRVFISDSFEELLPKWLSFLVGLVDSDSMPLNVSREMLQMAEGMKVIKKKLVRKAIEMIKKLSDAEEKAREGSAEEGSDGKKSGGWFSGKKSETEDSDAKKAAEEATTKYSTFWKHFGKALKMGLIEDTANRRRLMPLLRFHSSTSPSNLTSLEAYVSRMKPNQTGIYYLVGTGGVDELKRSPFVEAVTSRGYEVIFFTDALDEYMMGHVNEYDDKTFINISKDDLKLEEGKDDKAKEKRAAAHYKGLASWWKKALNDSSISAVKTSRRLASAPCVVVSGKWGWSATMERIARAQALTDSDRSTYMRGQRTLEINPRHPLVRELRARWEANPDDDGLALNAKLLYETCLMESGFLLDDAKAHNDAVLRLLAGDLGVGDLATLDEEDYPEIEDDSKKKKGGDSSSADEGASGDFSGFSGFGGDGNKKFDEADIERMMAEIQAKTEAEAKVKDEL